MANQEEQQHTDWELHCPAFVPVCVLFHVLYGFSHGINIEHVLHAEYYLYCMISVCARMDRTLPRVVLFILHFILTLTNIVLLATRSPIWAYSFQDSIPNFNSISTVGFLEAMGLRSSTLTFKDALYSRVADPDYSVQTCKHTALPKAVVDLWSPASYLNAEIFKSCQFKKYSETMDAPADPRDLSLFASGTPRFMFVTIQVLFTAHCLWAFTPVKKVLQRWCGIRVIWPVDLVVSWVILGGWCVTAFVFQKTEKIVYNNVLLAVLLSLYSGFILTFWSWRNAGHGSLDREDKKLDIDTISARPNTTAARLGFINVDIMRPTSMPIVPALDQGEELGTWHTVHNAVDKLDEYDLLPMPGMLMYSSTMPIWVVSCLFLEGNVWRHTELFNVALFTFVVVVLCAPLYSVVRIAKTHAKNESEFPEQILSGWMFLCFFMMFVSIVAAVGYAWYVFHISMLFNSTTMLAVIPVICTAVSSVFLYSLVLWRLGIEWAVWDFEIRLALTSVLSLVLFLR